MNDAPRIAGTGAPEEVRNSEADHLMRGDDAAANAALSEEEIALDMPLVVLGNRVLRNPTLAELAAALGITTANKPVDVLDLVVVGAGPAGLAASVYGASEGLRTALLDGERSQHEVCALFIVTGAEPHTEWLQGAVGLDGAGFILTGADLGDEQGLASPLQTSAAGVFAVGDARSGSTKRVAAAVGEGSMAIRFADDHIRALPRSR
jgi:alkyl hydroperoxide reductase subunit AhpF